MWNRLSKCTALIVFSLFCVLPASAQTANFDLSTMGASSGSQGNTTYATGQGPTGAIYAQTSRPTTQQNPGSLPPTTLVGLAPIFGMGSGYYGGYNAGADVYGGGATGAYGGNAQPLTGGQLAQVASVLPGSAFAQAHPRRTEVLDGASNLYNQVVADQSQLGANAVPLANQALNIADQEQAYALQNEGYITLAQQAQLNGQEAALGQEIASQTGF